MADEKAKAEVTKSQIGSVLNGVRAIHQAAGNANATRVATYIGLPDTQVRAAFAALLKEKRIEKFREPDTRDEYVRPI